MPPPRKPWTQAAIDVLSDGEWHSREELLDVMARHVDPARAVELRRRRRDSQRRLRHGGVIGDRPTAVADEIRAGSRLQACTALDNLERHNSAVERSGDLYRMKKLS
jgi:hypothetical protein